MMNDENTLTTEELSEDQWWVLLYSLVTDIPEKEWSDFSHDLIYKDRFSSSHKVVDVIKHFSERCTYKIKKGRALYRARIYHQDPLREFLSEMFSNSKGKKTTENVGDLNDYYNMQLAAIVMEVKNGTERGKEITDAYNKWKRKRFKGYNSSESGIPPANRVSSGRLNPERIKYLYLAEDPQTAVYEVRPTIGKYVSVATFKTTDEIKIYDLVKKISPQGEENPKNDFALFSVIQQRFSEPNSGDILRYLPTQYLGEQIKKMGFDGIRFNSSLNQDGVNVVLFDDKKCKAICSDMIKVGNIKLQLDNPEIYQLEEYLNNLKLYEEKN